MNFEEALKEKQDFIKRGNGLYKENKIYIIPEIPKEGDAFLQLVFRGKIAYNDELCKKYSTNGKFSVWLDPS